MIENNEDRCRKLAEQVVWDWDMDDLVSYAIQQLISHYLKDKESFNDDWRSIIED